MGNEAFLTWAVVLGSYVLGFVIGFLLNLGLLGAVVGGLLLESVAVGGLFFYSFRTSERAR